MHLVLHPDDLWLAIITQFSLFVKGNSEELRKRFVAHEGEANLVVDSTSHPTESVMTGDFAKGFAQLIENNAVDPGLRDWIVPNFTTTTNDDRSVASIVLMASMQNYFHCDPPKGCGFPSVTLEGDRADWIKILTRVCELPKYGDETRD